MRTFKLSDVGKDYSVSHSMTIPGLEITGRLTRDQVCKGDKVCFDMPDIHIIEKADGHHLVEIGAIKITHIGGPFHIAFIKLVVQPVYTNESSFPGCAWIGLVETPKVAAESRAVFSQDNEWAWQWQVVSMEEHNAKVLEPFSLYMINFKQELLQMLITVYVDEVEDKPMGCCDLRATLETSVTFQPNHPELKESDNPSEIEKAILTADWVQPANWSTAEPQNQTTQSEPDDKDCKVRMLFCIYPSLSSP